MYVKIINTNLLLLLDQINCDFIYRNNITITKTYINYHTFSVLNHRPCCGFTTFVAGTDIFTCTPEHGGARPLMLLVVTHPFNDRADSCVMPRERRRGTNRIRKVT